jgi:ATP-dependent RNA helicase DDX54/DBP10
MMAPQKASTLRWDRKNKRVVKGDGGGADNKKLIRTESGARLPASYRSGKFEEWKQKKRTSIPRVGEAEDANSKPMFGAGKRWKHKGVQTSKAFDKSGETKTKSSASRGAAPRPGKGQGQGGTRNMDQIVRNRKLKENRTRRSTQPGKRKPTGGGGGGGKGGGKGGRR